MVSLIFGEKGGTVEIFVNDFDDRTLEKYFKGGLVSLYFARFIKSRHLFTS
jgi:hypothetical protein